MNEELKPCPFCGGGAVIEKSVAYPDRFHIGCADVSCAGTAKNGVLWSSSDAAIEAWNRRYERTCKPVMAFGALTCSECYGDDLVPCAEYCHKCGAKVVKL